MSLSLSVALSRGALMYSLPGVMSSRPANLLIEAPTSRKVVEKSGSVMLDIWEVVDGGERNGNVEVGRLSGRQVRL